MCCHNHKPASLQGCCFSLPHLRQHVGNCAERLSLIPLHPLGTSCFRKRSDKKLRKLCVRWWAVFHHFLAMCSYSCWRKRSRKALRQHSASALKSFRKVLGCIIILSHLRQGKEKGGQSHLTSAWAYPGSCSMATSASILPALL